MIRIAVLMTCYNRKLKTFNSLKKLFSQSSKNRFRLYVYLVDDNSTDGTYELIKKKFPTVKIIKGNGNLFWGGGTNLAWRVAINDKIKFDYFMWLNDDTYLFKNAVLDLLNVQKFLGEKKFISVGSTLNYKKKWTYGGAVNLKLKYAVFKNKNVIPKKKYQYINRFNGNIVLISKQAFNQLGYQDKYLFHKFGDIDYSVRAENKKIPVILSKNYQGLCEKSTYKNKLADLFFGKKILFSGLVFTFKHGGILWPLHFISLFLNVINR